MSKVKPIVIVIDDDAAVRRALQGMLETIDLDVRSFSGADEFLSCKFVDAVNCIVLDVRLPGRSGFDVQRELAESGIVASIIFMTGHGDIPMSVRAMKAGALDFLAKPFRDQDLLDAVRLGIQQDHARRERKRRELDIRDRFATLTPREREILALLGHGWPSKRIAAEAKLSEVTVRVHRGQVMRKMGAKSIADLVRMTDMLGIGAAQPQTS